MKDVSLIKKILLYSLSLEIFVGLLYFVFQSLPEDSFVNPLGDRVERPLDVYAIPTLQQTSFPPSEILFDEPTATESAFTVQPFSFFVGKKKVTGLAHVPTTTEKVPVIVQFRGYVNREIYEPGIGTSRSAEVFAKNGYLTLAPDFLGYGGSDMPSINSLEERFETYTTALTLLASVPTIPFVDTKRIGVWAHSNGGQIALTVLTVMGERGYPTTLWAPVTKPFPYNILYYTDEFSDRGKILRRVVAEFEKTYDVDLYSFDQYLSKIRVPLQFHQGTADDAVPFVWSDTFVEKLKEQDVDVQYYRYPGADHNMMPSWNTVINRDIGFFEDIFSSIGN